MTVIGYPRVYSLRRGGELPPAGAVRVDRRTPFGNPFKIPRDARTNQEAVDLFARWLAEPAQAVLRTRVRAELRGKDLVCWCAPKPCHATVLIQVANEVVPAPVWKCTTCGDHVVDDLVHHAQTGHGGFENLTAPSVAHYGMRRGPWVRHPDPAEIGVTTHKDGGWG